jgi:hypothetical protein
VFSKRLWSLGQQSGMSRRLAQGAEVTDQPNRLQAPSVFGALLQVSHSDEGIAESR